MTTLKLQAYCSDKKTEDGDPILVDLHVAKSSLVIKSMVENLQRFNNGIDDDGIIPLFDVDEKTLKKVVEWMHFHSNDPEPEPLEEGETIIKRIDDITIWDEHFLQVERSELFKIMNAANILEIKGLLSLTCKWVARTIRGKTSKEIQLDYDIYNDFYEAEETLIRSENYWYQEK